MSATPIVIAVICILLIAYRLYGTFMAAKVLKIKDDRETPAHKLADGKDYVPTNKWVSFGHHFAAIAAAGPLVGPVLAAQFGYLPGLLWLLIGAVIGGAVHDMVVLFASMRQDGQSLSEVAKRAGTSRWFLCRSGDALHHHDHDGRSIDGRLART